MPVLAINWAPMKPVSALRILQISDLLALKLGYVCLVYFFFLLDFLSDFCLIWDQKRFDAISERRREGRKFPVFYAATNNRQEGVCARVISQSFLNPFAQNALFPFFFFLSNLGIGKKTFLSWFVHFFSLGLPGQPRPASSSACPPGPKPPGQFIKPGNGNIDPISSFAFSCGPYARVSSEVRKLSRYIVASRQVISAQSCLSFRKTLCWVSFTSLAGQELLLDCPESG